MDLEIVILSEVSQRKTNIIVELICGIKKKTHTNKLIYKTETDSLTQETNLWLPKERWGGEEIISHLGLQIQTTIYKVDKQKGPTV